MDSDSQIFWTFFITTMCGFLLALGRQMYKSKCTEIDVCCIHIKRDVTSEEKIDEIQMSRPQSATSGASDVDLHMPTNV